MRANQNNSSNKNNLEKIKAELLSLSKQLTNEQLSQARMSKLQARRAVEDLMDNKLYHDMLDDPYKE